MSRNSGCDQTCSVPSPPPPNGAAEGPSRSASPSASAFAGSWRNKQAGKSRTTGSFLASWRRFAYKSVEIVMQ